MKYIQQSLFGSTDTVDDVITPTSVASAADPSLTPCRSASLRYGASSLCSSSSAVASDKCGYPMRQGSSSALVPRADSVIRLYDGRVLQKQSLPFGAENESENESENGSKSNTGSDGAGNAENAGKDVNTVNECANLAGARSQTAKPLTVPRYRSHCGFTDESMISFSSFSETGENNTFLNEKKEEEKEERKIYNTLCPIFDERTLEEVWNSAVEYSYSRLNDLIAEVYRTKDNKIDDFRVTEEKQLPKEQFSFTSLTAEEIKTTLGRQWKKQLVNLVTLVELFEHITSNDYVTVLNLSSRSKNLVELFGCKSTVSNVIKTAENVGLIKTVDASYRFSPWESFSKKYGWNKSAQRVIKELCRAEGITAIRPAIEAHIEATEATTDDLETVYQQAPAKYRLTAKTRLVGVSDKQMIYGIHRNYPMIADYEKKVAELNKSLPLDERIKFRVNVSRSKDGKAIVKTGIRATNSLVSLKDNRHCSEGENTYTRQDMLLEKFGGVYTEIDVTSSVPRVTYLLNHGTWLPDGQDLYESMYGRPFPSPQLRTAFKNFFMSLYFDSSAKQASHHLSLKHQTDTFIANNGKAAVVETVKGAQTRVTDFLGRSWGSEIFMHESCIYIDVFAALVKAGYRVIQVYDGFYIEGRLTAAQEAQVWSIIRESAEAYYRRYKSFFRGSDVSELEEAEEVAEAIDDDTPNADFWARFAV